MNSRGLVADLLHGSERLPLLTQVALVRLAFPELIALDTIQVGVHLLTKGPALVDLCVDLQDRIRDEGHRFISREELEDLSACLSNFHQRPMHHRICLASMTIHLNRALAARTA